VSSKLESLLCGYGFGLQQYWKELGKASVLTVSSATLSFGEKKGSKRYRIALASSALAKKAFERMPENIEFLQNPHISMVPRRLDYITKHCNRGL